MIPIVGAHRIDRDPHAAYRVRMITATRKRLDCWQSRTAERLNGWPVRRRWTVFVLLPASLLCCVGSALAVPVGWVVDETVKASRGASSPSAAADAYLTALSYGNDEGLTPLLDDRHQGGLLEEWRAYRTAMQSSNPPPSRLDVDSYEVTSRKEGRANITALVGAMWWNSNGGAIGYNSSTHPWRFSAVDDNGWRITDVEPFQWCGGYVRTNVCG